MTAPQQTGQAGEGKGRMPLSPAVRQRLQACFQHGSKSAATGQFDYATEMFLQCVKGDPGNLIYAQNFLGNLQKKYNNNKTGAGKLAQVKLAGTRAALKKAVLRKEWELVLQHGWELLKANPWDASALADMATACGALGYDECEVAYLRAALEGDLKDPEINRRLGRALAAQGQFDQAIACWMRVKQANPQDQEADRAIHNLTVQRTITKGGYEEAESSTEVMVDRDAQAERLGLGGAKLTPEQQLEKAIKKNPAEVSNYLELAELHIKNERFREAIQVLEKALQVGGGDINIRERREDVELQLARQQLAVAEQRAREEQTPEAQALAQQFKTELNHKEIEIYRHRCERYPSHLGFRFELAVRLQRARQYTEAIKAYQEARGDLKRKGHVLLNLGICFESIKQYRLALQHYEEAITELQERDQDHRKLALYRAGVLAMDRLKELDLADRHLSALAGLDFGFRDVAERLDKLAKMRDDNPPVEEV